MKFALSRVLSGLTLHSVGVAGVADDPDEHGPGPTPPAAGVTRRSLLGAIGAIGLSGGVAVVAACTAPPARSDAKNEPGHHDTHGDSRSGNWAGDDANAGITTLTSQVPIPAPFRVQLPVPAQLRPSRQTSDIDYYEITQTEAVVEIIPGLKTPILGYNGTFPGPTIVQNPGRRVVVTHRNALPVPTVVHLHGGTTPADSDGYPTDLILPAAADRSFTEMPAMPGMPAMTDPAAVVTHRQRDYTYPPQPRAATLWYHDHRMGFTGASVYRGLAGFHIAHDEEETALPLPRGAHDVPLMIADRAFAADGSFVYPALDATMHTAGVDKDSVNGVMGDVILVNGAPWPAMQVETARYRFRILNASNARTYELALDDPSRKARFIQIGTDHGLLPAPAARDTLAVSPAQRFDIIIDFSGHRIGDEITLINRLGSDSTANVMRFVVQTSTTDTSRIPATLSAPETITPTPAMTRRTVKFHRGGDDEWLINGRPFDPSFSEADVPGGSTELWTITSDFHHPFHIHNGSIQVVSREGEPPGPDDRGWKDTVFINKGERVQLAIRFSDHQGRYVFHCHNLEHEDMGMMATFRIT